MSKDKLSYLPNGEPVFRDLSLEEKFNRLGTTIAYLIAENNHYRALLAELAQWGAIRTPVTPVPRPEHWLLARYTPAASDDFHKEPKK